MSNLKMQGFLGRQRVGCVESNSFSHGARSFDGSKLDELQISLELRSHADVDEFRKLLSIVDTCFGSRENSGGFGGRSTFAETTPESFDGSKVNTSKIDEFGQTGRLVFKGPTAKPITAAEAKAIAAEYPIEAIVNPILAEIGTAATNGFNIVLVNADRIPHNRKEEAFGILEGLGYRVLRGDFTDTDDKYLRILW